MNNLAEGAEKVGKLAVAAALIAYCLGFLILNVHLGALGIFSIELARGRYVLVGGLFIGFMLAVTSPILAFYGHLHRAPAPPTRSGRFLIFMGVGLRYGFLFALLGCLLALLGGTSPLLRPPDIIGRVAALWEVLQFILKAWGSYLLLDTFFRCVSILRRRRSIREHVRDMVSANTAVGLYGLALALSVLAQQAVSVQGVGPLSGGWVRFFAASLTLYVFGTSHALMYGLGDPPTRPETTIPTAWWVAFRRTVSYAALGVLVGVVYCTHVFPFIPWSLGGGAPACARLEIDTSGGVTRSDDVMLLDRSDTRLLAIEKMGGATTMDGARVVEIPANNVALVVFCPP